MTIDWFRTTFDHMEWADARVWKTILDSPELASDEYILNTMMHIHETQRAFLSVWEDVPFKRVSRSDFESAANMCEWGGTFYLSALKYLDSISDAVLTQATPVPWSVYFARKFDGDLTETNLAETFHQLTSHSMHHRGQVARRIRELGVTPPHVDFIIWVWTGREKSEWPI